MNRLFNERKKEKGEGDGKTCFLLSSPPLLFSPLSFRRLPSRITSRKHHRGYVTLGDAAALAMSCRCDSDRFASLVAGPGVASLLPSPWHMRAFGVVSAVYMVYPDVVDIYAKDCKNRC